MRFLTKAEVAKTLSVSDITIHRLIRKGEIQTLKVGRAVRISEESLKEYVNRNLSGVSKGNSEKHPEEHTQRKLSESEFSLEGMFTEGEPIPKEAIDKVIREWERE